MARQRGLNPQLDLGQRLLQSKLELLNGTGGRRPSLALSILTGSVAEPRPTPCQRERERRYAARTVYLSDRHLRDLDAIVEAWQPTAARRLTRSAVLRQAIEHLRAEVGAGAEPPLE